MYEMLWILKFWLNFQKEPVLLQLQQASAITTEKLAQKVNLQKKK